MMPIDYKETIEPSYYFELSYNLGTAVSYLLRSGKKENNSAEQDIQKAINHLHFELDKIYNDKV